MSPDRAAIPFGELKIDALLVSAPPNVRYLTGFTGDNGLLLVTPARIELTSMMEMMQETMNKIAREGNAVIVGRSAPYFLRENPDAFHVFLYAPRSEKIRRLMAEGHTQADAAEQVDTVDRACAAADFLVQPRTAPAFGTPSSFIHRTQIEHPGSLAGARNEFNAVDRTRDFEPLERCVIELRFAAMLRVLHWSNWRRRRKSPPFIV